MSGWRGNHQGHRAAPILQAHSFSWSLSLPISHQHAGSPLNYQIPTSRPDLSQYARPSPVHEIYTITPHLHQYAKSSAACWLYPRLSDLHCSYLTPPPLQISLVCWLHLYPYLLQYSRCLPVPWVHSCSPDVFPSVSSGKPRVGNLGFSSQAHSFSHLPRIQSQNNSFCCFGNEFSTHANCSLTLNTHVGGGRAFSCLRGEGGGHHRGGFVVVVLLADIGGSLPLINRFTNTI